MRREFVKALVMLSVAVVLAACGDNSTTKPSGPVTLKFRTPAFRKAGSAALDTVQALVIVDGIDSVNAPYDSIQNFPRGTHLFEAHLDVDYLTSRFQSRIDPSSTVAVQAILPAGTCRVYDYDSQFCARHNSIAWSGTRIYCPASDFGEFCTFYPDILHIGATWPVDSAATQENEYIAHGKLMIGAMVEGAKVATAFYQVGDYSPRRRHHVVPGDSTNWQSEVWTDVRHVPIYPDTEPMLVATDRPRHVFGLSVRTTYYQPTAYKNALFIRFDVTNISDSADYRRVHPDEPIGGHTITDVYLAPLIDPDVGGIRIVGGTRYDDAIDDNGTEFPSDSLVVAYDQKFTVPAFLGGYSTKPGLVGMRLLEAPAGTTARGLILDAGTDLIYGLDPSPAFASLEDSTYNVISAGRTGARSNCTSTAEALVCAESGNPEAEHDVRIGWSVGPIASIAPGQSYSVTVAIIFAPPTAGTFTSGNTVNPVNTDMTNTTRQIYLIGGLLRTLGDQVKAVRVNGAPR